MKFRIHFYYNEMPGNGLVHAVLIQKTADDHAPEYPPQAKQNKIEGVVRLEGTVRTDGRIDGLKVLEGDATLAAASTEAIKKWHFHPAERNLVPVEETVRIRVDFIAEGERVRARVVWPEPGHSEIHSR